MPLRMISHGDLNVIWMFITKDKHVIILTFLPQSLALVFVYNTTDSILSLSLKITDLQVSLDSIKIDTNKKHEVLRPYEKRLASIKPICNKTKYPLSFPQRSVLSLNFRGVKLSLWYYLEDNSKA